MLYNQMGRLSLWQRNVLPFQYFYILHLYRQLLLYTFKSSHNVLNFVCLIIYLTIGGSAH